MVKKVTFVSFRGVIAPPPLSKHDVIVFPLVPHAKMAFPCVIPRLHGWLHCAESSVLDGCFDVKVRWKFNVLFRWLQNLLIASVHLAFCFYEMLWQLDVIWSMGSVVGTLPTTTTNCTAKTKLKKHTKLYNKNPKTKSKSASKSWNECWLPSKQVKHEIQADY